jgi:hypothetical protein
MVSEGTSQVQATRTKVVTCATVIEGMIPHGKKKAQWFMGQILKNYTRLALINTGQYELKYYRDYGRRMAARLGLRYEEIPGSNVLIKKMLHDPWNGDFVITHPGETISYKDFKTEA